MTCAACTGTIESHLKSLEGVVEATVSLLTHIANIQYRPNKIGLRTLIEEIEAIGFNAKYEAQSDKSDIRLIVNESVVKYRR
jgi:copper chaperone CopZ